LGTPNDQSARGYAITVTQGDPAWAGALAGKALGLPVYHITEPEVKACIAPEVYEEEVALAEMVLEIDSISAALKEVRSSSASQAG
jgi:hypothetical protein